MSAHMRMQIIKMVKPCSSSSFYLSTLFLFLIQVRCRAVPETHAVIHGSCSPLTTNSTTSITATLLASLLNTSSHSSFGRASVTAPNDVVLHGLFQCRGDLSSTDCSSCVSHSVSLLTSTCPAPSGGALQLQGCYVAAPITFLPFPASHDVVVYRKYSTCSRGGVGGRFKERVFKGLKDMSGPYRAVVGPEGVMGQAQCFQEMTQSRCQSCVAAAVNLLRRESGSSSTGDVFMNNCYARYGDCTDHAAYVARSAYGVTTTRAGSSDSGVKTFALIAGSLAGIVVLVIFLTFVCKEFA